MIMSINPFTYSDDNKRYHTLSYHTKTTTSDKRYKAVLDAGFSCPHIVNGKGGCTFCSIRGSGDFALDSSTSLKEQYEAQKIIMEHKWPHAKPIAYFQAYTNTYASLEKIKTIYDPFFSEEYDNVGVALGTRADCLSDEIIQYFHEMSFNKTVSIEIGVQSIHPSTNRLIHRGHGLGIVEEILAKCATKNFDVVIHLINGLPNETAQMMVESAQWLARQPVEGVKIHMLHILKHTQMGSDYQKNLFDILSMEEFIDVVIKQLEVLPPEMVIHRITGDAPIDDLIVPKWTIKKRVVLNNLDKEMKRQDTYQGKHYEG
jgi:radical SAM protein (TIGR01212 family)